MIKGGVSFHLLRDLADFVMWKMYFYWPPRNAKQGDYVLGSICPFVCLFICPCCYDWTIAKCSKEQQERSFLARPLLHTVKQEIFICRTFSRWRLRKCPLVPFYCFYSENHFIEHEWTRKSMILTRSVLYGSYCYPTQHGQPNQAFSFCSVIGNVCLL